MTAFLITFKPRTENANKGWPIESLRLLITRLRNSERVVENWRIQNRSRVTIGDRVFLLAQGKLGPAVIGYGRVDDAPRRGVTGWEVPVQFEQLVDPTTHVLASTSDLRDIEGAAKYWRTQGSGILLPDDVTAKLESLVVGTPAKARLIDAGVNADWVTDELIIALDFYLKHRGALPNKTSDEIRVLSTTLQRLGKTLFRVDQRSSTFRNANGVYMKLMNFRRLDPVYTANGKTGLTQGAKAEETIWQEFANDPLRCAQTADAIRASIDDPETSSSAADALLGEEIDEAAEGRLLTRKHVARERNRQLVQSKRIQALRQFGRLTCAVCGFDYAVRYGQRGDRYIECHHTKPVSTLAEGHKTHIDDLALVCANCHRMIHRTKPWPSVDELKALIKLASGS